MNACNCQKYALTKGAGFTAEWACDSSSKELQAEDVNLFFRSRKSFSFHSSEEVLQTSFTPV